jgi:hypothetical protein
MDWKLWIVMLPLAVLCWWVGFAATRRLRRDKQRAAADRQG